jgi:hypothetical protein
VMSPRWRVMEASTGRVRLNEPVAKDFWNISLAMDDSEDRQWRPLGQIKDAIGIDKKTSRRFSKPGSQIRFPKTAFGKIYHLTEPGFDLVDDSGADFVWGNSEVVSYLPQVR